MEDFIAMGHAFVKKILYRRVDRITVAKFFSPRALVCSIVCMASYPLYVMNRQLGKSFVVHIH